jgi:hypothetical protein
MQHRTRATRTCPPWCAIDHDQTAIELEGNPGNHLSATRRGTAGPTRWDIYATSAGTERGTVAVDLIRAEPGVLDLTPAEARVLAAQLGHIADLAEAAGR